MYFLQKHSFSCFLRSQKMKHNCVNILLSWSAVWPIWRNNLQIVPKSGLSYVQVSYKYFIVIYKLSLQISSVVVFL
jgi:hypothetical protein